MSGSFYIRVPDATEIDAGIGVFREDMDNSIASAASSIDSLVFLDSLTGRGADAIKNYFQEVHQTLLYLLQLLVDELDTIYNDPYYSGVMDAAEHDGQGEFPSWDMWDKARALENYATYGTEPIDATMRYALNAAPPGYSFAVPSTAQVASRMAEMAKAIDKAKARFEEAESAGCSALSAADDSYRRLYSALSQAITRCASGSVSMASYQSGDFRNTMADLGLQDLAAAIQSEQDEKADSVLLTKKEGANNRQEDIEIAERKAAEEKAFWAAAGEVLQVVLVGVAIAGVVAATGPVAIAFSLVGVVSAVSGLNQRASQLGRMSKDAGADLEKSDPLGKASKLKETGIAAETGYLNAGAYEFAGDATKARLRSDAANAGTKAGVSLITGVAGVAADKLVGDKLEGTDKLAYDEGKKLTEKGVDKVSGKIIDKAFDSIDVRTDFQKNLSKGAGITGTLASCAQIYTDYKVDQYDQVIDECREQRDRVGSYQDSLGSGGGRQWAPVW